MTKDEAKQLALAHLGPPGPHDEELAFHDDLCKQTSYGWILVYNSKRFIETGDIMHALGGNGPLIVIAATREVVAVPTYGDIDEGIREVERSRGLR